MGTQKDDKGVAGGAIAAPGYHYTIYRAGADKAAVAPEPPEVVEPVLVAGNDRAVVVEFLRAEYSRALRLRELLDEAAKLSRRSSEEIYRARLEAVDTLHVLDDLFRALGTSTKSV